MSVWDSCAELREGSRVMTLIVPPMAEEPKSAEPPQHLDPLDHVGRNLFESVDARQGRKERMGVDQNLRIMAVQTVDAHLGESAVLAVVLDPHAGLERESLRQARSIGLLEKIGPQDAHQCGSLAAQRRRTAGRDDHFVHGDAVLGDFEIEFGGLTLRRRHDDPQRLVTQGADLDGEFALGQILEKIVARSVGRGAERGADNGDRSEGDMFVRRTVDDMPVEVGIGIFTGRRSFARKAREQARGEKHRYKKVFHGITIWY